MSESSRHLPVRIYLTWEWWEKHYQQAHGRPERVDMDWLDATYLGRQRFLYEQWDGYGLGQAAPELDLGFVSKVIVYNCIAVPVVLGMKPMPKEVGGYRGEPLSEERLRALRPVAMDDTPYGQRVIRERETRLARYGMVTQMIDIGTAANNAYWLRGNEFYADLIADRDLAHHYLSVITETTCLAYRFVSRLFGLVDGFPLGNCNVVMMSPRAYIEMIREHDIRCVLYAAECTGRPPCTDLHHCDVRAEPFAEAYRVIPGLRSLQASHLTDIEQIHRIMPHVAFSAIVNPAGLLSKPAAQTEAEIDRCLAAGARDLCLWNIDPRFGPEEMRDLLGRIVAVASRHGREASFAVTPMSWEELGWEFPRYQLGGLSVA